MYANCPALRTLARNSPLWRHAVELDDASQAWAEVTPALVINRPSAMASNGSKSYQTALIWAAGFEVPDTLVTTDPAAALAFRERHGSVIYKSVSGVRSIVSKFGDGHLERLEDIANCPTQFQEYVAGTDWRVHVVGEEVFASEIICDSDDYRYSARTGRAPDIRAATLAPALAARCRELATTLGCMSRTSICAVPTLVSGFVSRPIRPQGLPSTKKKRASRSVTTSRICWRPGCRRREPHAADRSAYRRRRRPGDTREEQSADRSS